MLAGLVMAVSPTGAGADEVRGWNFGHFGRLVIDTGAPVNYRIENRADRLVLLFDAPLDPDAAVSLTGAADRLSVFLGAAELGGDGRHVVLTPTAELRVNDFATDSGVAVDIWFAEPRNAPDAASAGSEGDAAPVGPAGSGVRLSLAPPAAMAAPASAASSPPASSPPASSPPASDREDVAPAAETAAPGQIASPAGRAGAEAVEDEPGRIRPREANADRPVAAEETSVDEEETDAAPEAGQTETVGDPVAPRQEIRVRAGQHPTYSRLVFDRPDAFSYRVSREGAAVLVRFDASADADLSRVRPAFLNMLTDIAAVPAADALTVRLEIDPEATVRHVALDSRVVVDLIPGRHRATRYQGSELLPPVLPEPAEADIAANEAPATMPAEAGAEHEEAGDDRAAAERDVEDGAEDFETADAGAAAAGGDATSAGRAPGQVAAVPDIRAHFALPPRRPAPPLTEEAATSAAPDDGRPAAAPGDMRPATAAPTVRVGDSVPRRTETARPAGSSSPAEPSPRAEPSAPAGTDAGPQGRQDGPGGMIAEWGRGDGTGRAAGLEAGQRDPRPARPETGSGSASFAPEIPTALAVFERAGSLWIVFAAAGPFDVNTLLAAGAAGFGPGTVIPADGGFAFRFDMPRGRHPMAVRDDNAWQVRLVDEPAPPARPLHVHRTTEDGFAPRLFIATAAAHGIVTVRDPLVGDRLVVVPIREGSTGLPQARQFPQLRLLPAAQGVVVEPLSDNVDVQIAETGIDIRAGESLWVSDVPDRDPTLLASGTAGDQLFDVASWASQPGAFNRRRQDLTRQVALSSEESRHAARLDLARFFIAHGFGPEAIGELDLIAAENPEVARRLDFIALRGAARILAGDAEAGSRDLQRGWLAESREAALWRAVAAADQGNWTQAAEEFDRAEAQLYAYPQPLRDQLLLRAGETWVETGARRQATEALGRLAESGAGRREYGPALAYLRGRLALQRDDARAAEIELARAANSNDRLYHRLGEMALIRHERRQGDLPLTEEIARLEALRFAWRGDRLEFEALTELADAYWRGDRFREALETWQDVAALFPHDPESQAIADALSERLISLFDGPDAEDITPLSAVALFRDYEHLIPTEAERDRLTAILAERLVEMDLLSDASDLLQPLVAERLAGREKARMGARLAGIRLLDDQPEAAIAALDESAVAGLDDTGLQEERRLLRARALSELDDAEAALVLLEPAVSDLADSARLDIAWRANDWPTAARLLAERRAPPPADGSPIAPEQAEIVVNSAIALVLSGDREGLDALVGDYGSAMRDSAQASTFALVTRPSIGIGPLVDLASIREQMAEVDLFQQFLTRYRDAAPAATN